MSPRYFAIIDPDAGLQRILPLLASAGRYVLLLLQREYRTNRWPGERLRKWHFGTIRCMADYGTSTSLGNQDDLVIPSSSYWSAAANANSALRRSSG